MKLARKQVEDESGDKITKQPKLTFSRSEMLRQPQEVRRLVAEYVVEDMLPLSTVESPAFQKLVSKIPVATSSNDNKHVLQSRKTFTKDLDKAYTVMTRELKKTIEVQNHVSTTANLWSANNRSYLGVTMHWIDNKSLKWRKAAIACRRFRGRHTYDKIATEIEDIFSEYGLTHDKIMARVTDNGSNFVKAFREYQHVESEEEEVEEDSGEGEVHFTDLHSVLSADDEDAQVALYVLPPHHRCAAHTLNLVANNEVDKWLATNPESRAVYRSATAKCSLLWTKSSRATVAAECVEEVSDKKLIVPTVTWWNSFYDAYARITEMPLTDINNLCTQFQIKCMNDREYQFLMEYCAIMKPFTVALDILQGEETCFYGKLQQTL
ncbi:uncharacterized protein LOC132870355 [Neoarius graeffei]|uniref:uncharacterized protein LOC132870355 n=1 Tax=Neoarius graeffei TaxID=443677 RepID=UPI00298BDCF0|nr:uncharacterized protein LOC132870355 [Neoarius graeffei]